MTGQQKDLVSRFVTPEQLEALMKLKESLRPEEIDELRSAGERLLKDVKTEKDLAIYRVGARRPEPARHQVAGLRSILKGMQAKAQQSGERLEKSARSAGSGCACSSAGRKRRSVRKRV